MEQGTSVTGDITAGGEVKVEQGSTVQGNIVSGANVKVEKNATVTGNITAATDVKVEQGATVQGNIVAGGPFKLEQNATTTGSVTAGGDAIVEQGAIIQGDVAVGGAFSLGVNARVEGNLTVTGALTIESGAVVTGTTTTSAPAPSIPAVPVIPPIQLVSITPVSTPEGPATQILTTLVPQVSGTLATGYLLKWEGLVGFSVASLASTTLIFQANASLAEGAYCNEAWVDPGGRNNTTSGLTGKIVAGSPASSGCPGAAVVLTKSVTPDTLTTVTPQTYTYTITLENTGNVNLNLNQLKDLLPAGFTYQPGFNSRLTLANATTSDVGGQSQLIWFSTSTKPVIMPGETKTQVFSATATAGLGNHYNEVWVSFDEIAYEVYAGPTAVVRIMALFQTCGTDGKTSVSSEVWLGADTNLLPGFTIVGGPCP